MLLLCVSDVILHGTSGASNYIAPQLGLLRVTDAACCATVVSFCFDILFPASSSEGIKRGSGRIAILRGSGRIAILRGWVSFDPVDVATSQTSADEPTYMHGSGRI